MCLFFPILRNIKRIDVPNNACELRIITEPQAVRHGTTSYARVPRDVIDITSGTDIEKFSEMCKSLQETIDSERDIDANR